MRKLWTYLSLLWAVVLCAGCASTTTQRIEVAPEVVEAEKEKQRRLALQTQQRQQNRLSDIAYPLRRAATPLCREDVGPVLGIQFGNVHVFDDKWKSAARAALSINDTLRILHVADSSAAAEAGLQRGDKILELNDRPTTVGEGATAAFSERMTAALEEEGTSSIEFTIRRDARTREIRVRPDSICEYSAQVVRNGSLNAFADGNAIYITSAMMRFTTDRELAVVVSHELAHNAMRHIEKKKENALVGGILGALADVAIAATTGYSTGGQYAQSGAQLAGQAHSQDFEREADYVGIYILARADFPLENVPRFWRHMAQANPESIEMAHTHPTSAERFVRLEKAIEEVRRKQRKGEKLLPDMQEGKTISGGSTQ